MIDKGKSVVVFKGRKVPVGTVGVVAWIGSNRWGTSVGLRVEGSDKLVFTSIDNVKLDESPEATAREIDAAHESAIWYDAKRLEREAGLEAARAALGSVTLQKGDTVTPKSGNYAGRICRVIWVGAKAEGVRVGVVPKAGRPIVSYRTGGRPVWPSFPADWLPLSEVA